MAHPPLNVATLQKVFLGVGLVGLAVSVLMAGKFGYSMSILHAVALCTVTFLAAFIFPMKTYMERAGFKTAARVVAVIGAFFVGVEFFSHLGYTIGMRERSSTEATVQTVAYENRQDTLKSNKANLAMWRDQLAKLKEANVWAATVSADGLRASLESANKAIELEEARGGCKARCLALMKSKADIENRIAVAEQVSDLTKRIEATQRIIDNATQVAVETKKGFSPVRAQTDFVAQIGLVAFGTDAEEALRPGETALTWTTIGIGFVLALAATLLPTTAFYLAFFGHDVGAATSTPATVETAAETTGNGVREVIREKTIIADEVVKRWASRPEVQKLIAA